MGSRRDGVFIPKTVKVTMEERRALEDILDGGRWFKATQFIHEAIMEKVHKERARKRYGGN